MQRKRMGVLQRIILFVLTWLVILKLYLYSPIIFTQTHTCIYIQSNQKFSQLLSDIDQKTRYIAPLILKIYAKFKRFDRHLAVGEYCFTDHDSIVSMMEKINHAVRERHKFTIVDGWTYQELAQHLAMLPSLRDTSILQDENALAIALKLKDKALEGQFYPLTYYYAYPETVLDLLRQAHLLMEKRIQLLYSEPQVQALFKNADELLVAASIIQREASDAQDQKFVASVLINRLQQHMKLQMDPTVIYGLRKNYTLPLTKQELKSNTLYNTYLYSGLPPTPICMPGETALDAAAHPQDSHYFYYVTKQKNRVLQFSETLPQQNLAIKKYLLHQENSH